ncbi:hypothetical protein HPO96_03110 [Kribbella sandramycini]|uniref:Uncharacterized protein YndB with AHSA1/START domain n=1 Tax=Kribbella sandramycini TaxID=60450 RepID=A0A7Y4KV03_9ACTN|nr:hypothetical protein [Kribbella sandramycini]MBB6568181.1 uncharacterized protein YndB with AHSA1/START domain [Kribbella sandramycini]NOL39225.1 hypothetical protein [Kribbella sandramycini]
MNDSPRIKVTVAAPPSTVWAALRDKEQIRQWHGWEFTGGVDGSLDQEIELIYFTDVSTEGHAIDLNGGDRIELADAAGGGTELTLIRAAVGDDPDWARYYDDITEGWITFMQQLRFAVERHPGDTRRTVLVSGTGKTAPATALDASKLNVGDRYELDFPAEKATGTVWFRSEHQLGLTVDGWNDGLVVLTHDAESGAARALLSLYGVDEARHTELTKHWQDWWTAAVQ